jgi:3D (Asp-Asp-Asp) domain-containing protein
LIVRWIALLALLSAPATGAKQGDRYVELSRVTAYSAEVTQTDSDPLTTACGKYRLDGIALSPDLFRKPGLNCGDRIKLELPDGSVQTRVVWDTMNKRFTRSADIPMKSRDEAIVFGVKKGKVYY